MIVKTPVIGIPNWWWKKQTRQYAEKYPVIEYLDIYNFCFECSRHFSILLKFDDNNNKYIDTEYYGYKKHQGNSHKDILKFIKDFRSLYILIKNDGCKKPPIVTDDGCRLDGSHRLVILIHLKIKKAKINIVSYENIFSLYISKQIRQQVKEYRLGKYNFHE